METLIIVIVATVLVLVGLNEIRRLRTPEKLALDGDGKFETEVVGESHYQDALYSIAGGHRRDGVVLRCDAELILDDGNRYDDKAVRVEISGRAVGHLSRNVARKYRKTLAKLGKPRIVGVVSAEIRGGWDRGGSDVGQFGVWLDL